MGELKIGNIVIYFMDSNIEIDFEGFRTLTLFGVQIVNGEVNLNIPEIKISDKNTKDNKKYFLEIIEISEALSSMSKKPKEIINRLNFSVKIDLNSEKLFSDISGCNVFEINKNQEFENSKHSALDLDMSDFEDGHIEDFEEIDLERELADFPEVENIELLLNQEHIGFLGRAEKIANEIANKSC